MSMGGRGGQVQVSVADSICKAFVDDQPALPPEIRRQQRQNYILQPFQNGC